MTAVDVTVGQQGSVLGATAFRISYISNPPSLFASVSVTLDNSGLIKSTSGPAVVIDTNLYGTTLTNRATGTIGAIQAGGALTLSNAGLVDGDQISALTVAASTLGSRVVNTGTIRAAGAGATLALGAVADSVTTSGRIVNSGSGPAIALYSGLITVQAGGSVESAAATSITVQDSLTLANRGTISGAVVVAGTAGSAGSIIDSTGGTIGGGLTLGAADDTLIVDRIGDRLVTGVVGAIDAGAGRDTLRVRIGSDMTLAAAPALASFEQTDLQLANNATVTLAPGYTQNGTLGFGGTGTLLNTANVITTGSLFTVRAYADADRASFVNAGSITSSLAGGGLYAVDLPNPVRFENRGTITATSSAGVSLRSTVPAVNSGTITAVGTALQTTQGSLTNSGTIRSTSGTGLSAGRAGIVNTGLIEGALAGLAGGDLIDNSGTIRSNGVAVRAEFPQQLFNRASGVIVGGEAAIRVTAGATSQVVIANAGRIDGDVVLANGATSRRSIYQALPGGVLNGNLTLASSDTFVTDLAGSGGGRFAGVTGTVTATDAILRYRIMGATSTTLALPTGFVGLGYELGQGSALVVAPGAFDRGVTFAGIGTVDLSASITATNMSAVAATDFTRLPSNVTETRQTVIDFMNRGSLSFVNTSATSDLAAVLVGNGSFVNLGTIRTSSASARTTAISGGGIATSVGATIVNQGSILLDGGIGISGNYVTNSGSIVQTPGGRDAVGVSAQRLINTGTIATGGVALLNVQNVDNSGTVSSAHASAIENRGNSIVLNRTGGVIVGSATADAVRLGGGSGLVNAGTINGRVDMDFGPLHGDSGYSSDNGVLNGDLHFGVSRDILSGSGIITGAVDMGGGNDLAMLLPGARFGGTVDGGAGSDRVELTGGTSAAASYDLSRYVNFESLGVTGGFATLAGSARFQVIDVIRGRLEGSAGSTIIGNVQVASGAAFASGGTVVGNVSVASGGALGGGVPGTLTVTGNVALAGGSATTLTLSSAASDTLAIGGGLTIASGASLAIAGTRPPTPGSALTLISATGGISGVFTTIIKAPGVFGYLSQSATTLSLTGLFDASVGSAQARSAIDYVNGSLVAGRASPTLIAAVPSLLASGGATNSAAFGRLTPEPYASASDIGTENALIIAGAARNVGRSETKSGAYIFGQGLGGWRRLTGDPSIGSVRANINSYGAIAGVGAARRVGYLDLSLAAFGGYLNARQSVGALGARTTLDSVAGGLIGHATAGGFSLSTLVGYSGGDAKTRRTLPGGATSHATYALRNWVADASLAYCVPIAAGWTIVPRAGLTYSNTRRGGATENGTSPFALVVQRRKSDATFVDGKVALEHAFGAGGRGWLNAGARHQLDGEGSFAQAAFVNDVGSFSVLGARRKSTIGVVEAGAALALTDRLHLFGSYSAETGDQVTSNITTGLSLSF